MEGIASVPMSEAMLVLVTAGICALFATLTTYVLTRRFLNNNKDLRHSARVIADALETEKRKSSEYFKSIEGAVAESKKWRDLYYSQVAGHSKAQSMLMEERKVLVTQLRKAGIKPKARKAVEMAVEEFSGQHPPPPAPALVETTGHDRDDSGTEESKP